MSERPAPIGNPQHTHVDSSEPLQATISKEEIDEASLALRDPEALIAHYKLLRDRSIREAERLKKAIAKATEEAKILEAKILALNQRAGSFKYIYFLNYFFLVITSQFL